MGQVAARPGKCGVRALNPLFLARRHLASSWRRILPVVLRGTCSEVTNSINRGRL